MRIVFVWTGFTSYMADCWRTLAARPDVELKIWVEQVRQGNIAFRPDSLMRGLDFKWRHSDEIGGAECREAEAEIAAFRPDALFICGWARKWPPYLAKSPALAAIPKVLCCDMPWEWRMRKFAARFVLWRHLRRFRKILVPGRRAALYARWLGFRDADVVRGEYGIDVSRFGMARGAAASGFVFVGRLVADKDMALLAKAYGRYRELAAAKGPADVWPLDVYGQGELAPLLRGRDGLSLHGFAQPEELPSVYARAGAFVLASRWDPWPLVILESCAAGLPVVCTKNCWNRYELVRENGMVVPSGDAEALARAMLEISTGENRVRRGEAGRTLAAPYSCEGWARRVGAIAEELRS